MKMKKILASLMVGAMVMTTVPVVNMSYTATAYAAKGGAKLGGGAKSAPKAAAPKAAAPKSNADTHKSVSGSGDTYKPSKDAKSLDKNAPAAGSKSNANTNTAANTQSGSRWGNALRTVGLLAGGMLLGSMLGNLFGSSMLGDIFGVIANVAMFLAVFMLIRWAWNRFRGNRGASYSRNDSWQSRPSEPVDVTPRDNGNRPVYQDISRISSGEYEAKSMADRYRNR